MSKVHKMRLVAEYNVFDEIGQTNEPTNHSVEMVLLRSQHNRVHNEESIKTIHLLSSGVAGVGLFFILLFISNI